MNSNTLSISYCHLKVPIFTDVFLKQKIQTLTRDPTLFVAQRRGDNTPAPRNLDPKLHPFQKAREYTRALNAVKLQKIFAKPFVGQLGNGHVDGVYALAKDEHLLTRCASGSGDGVLKVWDIAERTEIASVNAHKGTIRGLCFVAANRASNSSNGSTQGRKSAYKLKSGNAEEHSTGILSCASDGLVKLWSTSCDLISTFDTQSAAYSVDRHYAEPKFAVACASVQVWDVNRSNPVHSFQWGVDNYQCVRFNRSETSVLASTGFDNSIVLYDIRAGSPISKIITTLRSNKITFNPMEPMYFCSASEDHNLYLFDMRNTKRAANVFMDHVGAVIDVDFAPTGQEIVSGSYDRSIRIFRVDAGRSREVYHTKRMQRVFSVLYSMDSRYLLSGSDDGNVRLWRSEASRRAGVLSSRERAHVEYLDALKNKYRHMPELRRIERHRHLPRQIRKLTRTKRIEIESAKKREENHRRYQKDEKRVPEREKPIVRTEL